MMKPSVIYEVRDELIKHRAFFYKDAVKLIEGYAKRHGFKVRRDGNSGIMYEPGCEMVILFKKNPKGGTHMDQAASPVYAFLDDFSDLIVVN